MAVNLYFVYVSMILLSFFLLIRLAKDNKFLYICTLILPVVFSPLTFYNTKAPNNRHFGAFSYSKNIF